jgi:hypothetical protein
MILESDKIKAQKHLSQIQVKKLMPAPGKKSDQGSNMVQTGQGKRQP